MTTPQIVKVPFEGEIVDAEEIPVTATGPVEFTFALDGGGAIKVWVAVPAAFRLLGKTKENGDPIYVINLQVKNDFQAPERSDGK